MDISFNIFSIHLNAIIHIEKRNKVYTLKTYALSPCRRFNYNSVVTYVLRNFTTFVQGLLAISIVINKECFEQNPKTFNDCNKFDSLRVLHEILCDIF